MALCLMAELRMFDINFVGDQRETIKCSAAVLHISLSCWIVWKVSQIVQYFEQVTEHSNKVPQLAVE